MPILQTRAEPSADDLMRLYAKAEGQWAEHLAEPEATEWGTVLVNRDLGLVHDANHVRDARVPTGMSPADVVRVAGEQFARQGGRCHYWHTDDAAIAEHLVGAGHWVQRTDVLYLRRAPRAAAIDAAGGLTIIPARASYRHVRELAAESGQETDPAAAGQLAEANLMHLDDANVEGILALKDGVAVGRAFVLAVGEIGSIEHVHVAARFRRQGIGRTVLRRALEACARSTFRHVFITVNPGNAAAYGLYASLGFEKVGEVVKYRPAAL